MLFNRQLLLHSAKPQGFVCKKCNAESTTTLYIHCSYYHFLGLPVMPNNKTLHTECAACHAVIHRLHYEGEIRQVIERYYRQFKPPWWQYSGLVVIGLLLGLSSLYIGVLLPNKLTKEYAANPQVNDLWEIDLEDSEFYTLVKIIKIEGDTLWLQDNDMQIEPQSETSKIDRDRYWTRPPYKEHMGIIQIGIDDGTIDRIRRPGDHRLW